MREKPPRNPGRFSSPSPVTIAAAAPTDTSPEATPAATSPSHTGGASNNRPTVTRSRESRADFPVNVDTNPSGPRAPVLAASPS